MKRTQLNVKFVYNFGTFDVNLFDMPRGKLERIGTTRMIMRNNEQVPFFLKNNRHAAISQVHRIWLPLALELNYPNEVNF